jgi:hypothetical protein
VQVVCHTGAGQAFERDPHVLGHGRWCEAGAPSENKYKLGRAQVEPHGVRPPRIHEIARLAAAPHPRTMARIAAYRRDLLLTDSVASASQVRATSNKTLHPGTIPGPGVLTPPTHVTQEDLADRRLVDGDRGHRERQGGRAGRGGAACTVLG